MAQYFCTTCGELCSMMGHQVCEPDPALVNTVALFLADWRRAKKDDKDADPDEGVRFAVREAKRAREFKVIPSKGQAYSVSCRDVLRKGAVPSFHVYSGTNGFCPVCGLEVAGTDDSSRWRTVYRNENGAIVGGASQGARICINFNGTGPRRIEWRQRVGASNLRLVYADDCFGLGDKGETVNMDEQGGGGEYRSGSNQASAPEYQNSAGEAANVGNYLNSAASAPMAAIDAEVNKDGADETDPPPRVLCRAVHVYGVDGKGYQTARLVIAQEQNARFNKLTISEADGKGGYKTCNIRMDADAWAALKKSFNGYGDESIPAPEKIEGPSQLAKLQRANDQLMKQRSELRAELEKFRGAQGRAIAGGAANYERAEDRDDVAQQAQESRTLRPATNAKEPIPTAPAAPQAVLRGARGYEIDPGDFRAAIADPRD